MRIVTVRTSRYNDICLKTSIPLGICDYTPIVFEAEFICKKTVFGVWADEKKFHSGLSVDLTTWNFAMKKKIYATPGSTHWLRICCCKVPGIRI